MGKLLQIYQGWKNYLDPNPEIEKMADERVKICDECLDEKGNPMIEYAIKPIKLYLKCKKCFCHFAAMVRSPDKHCNLGKF